MQWLLNWAIAYATPYLVNWGPGYANLQSKIFFIWFGCCFVCIAFVYFLVYESKGLSLEEVDEMYNEVPSARESPSWRPTITFQKRNSVATQGGLGHESKENAENPTMEQTSQRTMAKDDNEPRGSWVEGRDGHV